jgi:hypothetical protein
MHGQDAAPLRNRTLDPFAVERQHARQRDSRGGALAAQIWRRAFWLETKASVPVSLADRLIAETMYSRRSGSGQRLTIKNAAGGSSLAHRT